VGSKPQPRKKYIKPPEEWEKPIAEEDQYAFYGQDMVKITHRNGGTCNIVSLDGRNRTVANKEVNPILAHVVGTAKAKFGPGNDRCWKAVCQMWKHRNETKRMLKSKYPHYISGWFDRLYPTIMRKAERDFCQVYHEHVLNEQKYRHKRTEHKITYAYWVLINFCTLAEQDVEFSPLDQLCKWFDLIPFKSESTYLINKFSLSHVLTMNCLFKEMSSRYPSRERQALENQWWSQGIPLKDGRRVQGWIQEAQRILQSSQNHNPRTGTVNQRLLKI